MLAVFFWSFLQPHCRKTQWQERLSSVTLGKLSGLDHDMANVMRKYRLRWLGHVARMPDYRLPKRLLFGELSLSEPRHGCRTWKHWRDVIMADLSTIGLQESSWYDTAQDRPQGRDQCQEMRKRLPPARVIWPGCHRNFSRPGDLTRHTPFCRATR